MPMPSAPGGAANSKNQQQSGSAAFTFPIRPGSSGGKYGPEPCLLAE
jgi:hypothetical protein